MGNSVDSAFIVKSDVAQRLSLFLPIVAALTLFGENLSEVQTNRAVPRICRAVLPALEARRRQNSGSAWRQAALLLGVWAGYGIIDILFKQLAKAAWHFQATCCMHLCWQVC